MHDLTLSRAGVSQGIAQEPTLYVLFTADISTAKNGLTSTFADGTAEAFDQLILALTWIESSSHQPWLIIRHQSSKFQF